MKTADQQKATQKCMRTPRTTVAVPSLKASLPMSTLATPWNSRDAVDR
jgi:hypothetical protein